MTQSKPDQMSEARALVERLQNYGCRSECEMHEDREDAADALTAALDENERLRHHLGRMLWHHIGVWHPNSFLQQEYGHEIEAAREALKGES